jgi:hypothetical protein
MHLTSKMHWRWWVHSHRTGRRLLRLAIKDDPRFKRNQTREKELFAKQNRKIARQNVSSAATSLTLSHA